MIPFSAVVFDLDGTLVDSYPAIHESLNHTLQAMGLPPLEIDSVKQMVGRGLENLMQQAVGPERWQEAVPLFRKSYDETHLRGTFLLPDVYSTLQELHLHRVKLAVASNKPAEYTKNILRHLRVDRFIQACAGPRDGIPPKPDPAMMQSLLSLLEVSADRTLYVGDMTLDVQTARNAGVRVALIPTGGQSFEDLLQAHPDYLLHHFSELPALQGV